MDQINTKRSEHLGQILEMFLRGIHPKDIAENLGITHQKVTYTLDSFRKDYLPTIASRGLLPAGDPNKTIEQRINDPFQQMLSPLKGPLTNEEMLYCSLYVSTGNSLKAVVDAGFDVGLDKGTLEVYNQNCLMRSEALKRKPNVQDEIRTQQKERMTQLQLDKDRVLYLHMSMIEQLQDEGDPKNRSYLVKLLDQVAKITGSYTHVVQTSELSADDVIDAMMHTMNEPLPPEIQEVIDEHS